MTLHFGITIKGKYQITTSLYLVLSLKLEDEVVNVTFVACLAVFHDLLVGQEAPSFGHQEWCTHLAMKMARVFAGCCS
jgi:hypothetical protein